MLNLQIEQKDAKGKGRVFEATLLGFIVSDWLWPQTGDNERPIFAAIAATEAQIRPFMANLQTGSKAISSGTKHTQSTFEFLRSARYTYATQRFEGMGVATIYLPELWDINPGMVDPTEVRFAMVPSYQWSVDHSGNLPINAMVGHALANSGNKTREELELLCPTASLFCSYLDNRTRAPITPDPCFHLQLLLACLEAGIAKEAIHIENSGYRRWDRRDSEFKVVGKDHLGLASIVGFKSTHDEFNTVLSECTDRYFAVKG